jgi:hypothetical protein
MNEDDLKAIEKRYNAVRIEPSWAACARTDVPALVVEVRRLRAALAHYADAGTWGRWVERQHPSLSPTPSRHSIVYVAMRDNGYDVAREALLGGTEEDR